ncbi:hypothetical protein LPJ73_003722 [Coemansia sp. RSA 2703]|nr:hypothetical protein LPJ73_003722 [Coemansia sp. RSA 2703]KAJ2371817.1 hypothetical protein IW150_004419 [Coemansia sp. RSA 2607]KAJ2392611.1 hypothetical protein GGI05_002628 [Coemansia sp. RSA 2603]
MNRPLATYIALLLLVYLWLSWGSDDAPRHSPDERAAYERQWWASFRSLDYAANSTYTRLPSSVRSAVDGLMHVPSPQPARSSNIAAKDDANDDPLAGFFHGTWAAEHISANDTHAPSISNEHAQYARPADGASGRLTLELSSIDASVPGTRLLHGTARLLARGFSQSLALRGIHFAASNAAVLYAVPQMHADANVGLVRAVPQRRQFDQAKRAYAQMLDGRLAAYDMPEDVARGCEYQLYVRFGAPAQASTQAAAAHVRPAGLVAQAVMYSPECRVSVATPHARPLQGISAARYQTRAGHYLRLAFVAMVAELLLLVGQMRHTPTHAAMAKISPYGLAMQAVLGCYIFIAHVSASLAPAVDIQLAYTGATFVVFTLLVMFALHYMMSVWRVQQPSDPDAQPSAQRTLWMTYLRFYGALAVGVFVIHVYSETMHPLAAPMMVLLLLTSYSYWVPQIIRNARRGTSRGLRKDYLLGTTLLNLIFPLYAFACPESLSLNAPSAFVWALVAYSFAQVLVLLLQDLLGPRFFVPASMLPEVYNYHPLLPPDSDEEAAVEGNSDNADDAEHDEEGSSSEDATPDQPRSARAARECAICIQEVDVSTSVASALFGRPSYMVTPCHHVYHTECLTRWMEMKLECPVCRAPLPPV